MRLIGLPRRVQPSGVHQTEIQTGRFFVLPIFGMPIAANQVPALLMEIVVMLPSWRPAPFVGTGVGPSVPLSVSVAIPFRFIPDLAHQDVMFLHDHGSGRVANL